MSGDNPLVQELREQLRAIVQENTALRDENAWQKRWISELRDTVAALTNTDTSAGFTLVTHKPGKSGNSLRRTTE